MAVVRRTFLPAVGLADRTVQVEDDLFKGLLFADPINPHPRQIRQGLQVLPGGQNLCLEAPHLTGGGGLTIPRSCSHHFTHHGIHRQPFRAVRVLVAGQAAVYRLPKQAIQFVLRILASAKVTKNIIHHCRQPHRFIELAIGEKTRIAGNFRAMKFQFHAGVKCDP